MNYDERDDRDAGALGLKHQLAETKAVLGDLLQEKVVGLTVYVLQFGEVRGAYLSLEAAKQSAQVHYSLGHWVEHNSHGRSWELKGDPQIRITEHKLK